MTDFDILKYKTVVFDFDGVIFNSNDIKSQAFFESAIPYGVRLANELVDYHLRNPGLSRYDKFAYFLSLLFKGEKADKREEVMDDLLCKFSSIVKRKLLVCEVAERLDDCRVYSQTASWMVVSASDQQELREVVAERELCNLFDGGVYGSPCSKSEILLREISLGRIKLPALLLGDSKSDFLFARKAGLDFVFISRWSDDKDWHGWVAGNGLAHVPTVKDVFF